VSEEPKVVDVLPSVRVNGIRGWKLGKIFDRDGKTQAARVHLLSKKERVWWNRVESRLERFRIFFVVESVLRWLG